MAYRNNRFDTIIVQSDILAFRLLKGELCYSNILYPIAEGDSILRVLSIPNVREPS